MNNATSLFFSTFLQTPTPALIRIGGETNFTGLVLFAAGLLLTLLVIAAALFGPKDGCCCLLCGACLIGCHRECCKRRKYYAETLDEKIRDWKGRSGPGLLDGEEME